MGAEISDGTVGKALDILDLVASIGRPVRFAELLSKCAYPKATLYRFLQTLTNQGMLRFNKETQDYQLGVRLVRLAHAAWQQASLAPMARIHIDKLSANLAMTVHLAQLEAGQVLYVDKRNPSNPIDMYSQAGKVAPAYCTGVGKAMLAFLEETDQARALSQQSYHPFTQATHTSAQSLKAELDDIRKNGIAYDREEHEPNIICVSASIVSSRGSILGALSVTNSTNRTTLEHLQSLAPILKACADNIATDVESWRFPEHNQIL